jgi:hypothetical protein
MVCAVLLAIAAAAEARPILAPTTDGQGSLGGVASVRRLKLDKKMLGKLRRRHAAVLREFPLGDARAADLVLERFEPFAAGARAEIVEADGPRRLAWPDQVYFRGTVAGDPSSLVVLIAGRRRLHGFVASRGDVFPFGPDGRGGHRTYSLRSADTLVHPPPGDFCANDLHPEAVAIPDAELARLAALPAVAAAPGTLRQADVAIDTDRELRTKFASDAAALQYLSSLAAAATAIYERDVAVRLRFSYVRLWGASPADPWTATNTSGQLAELRSHWNDPANGMAQVAGPRTVVHMISGKSVQGGIAYVNVLCNQNNGYGVSQVRGSFDLSQPSQVWDVVVVTHELGHNFGSPHTHCYSPPVDRCYAGESGCYAGDVVASRGTLMSYCHLLGGGLGNLDLVFGPAVVGRIGQRVAAATCLATVPGGSTTTTSSSPTTTSTTTTRPTTSTTSTSTTTTRPTTTRPPTTTTSSSTTTSRPPTTTSTTAPAVDADRDGIRDGLDACPGTAVDEPVDARGCDACPCAGPAGGWESHAGYVRCVRAAVKLIPGIDRARRTAVVDRARRASCGTPATTRCCVYKSADASRGRCRLLEPADCAGRAGTGRAVDFGPGSCSGLRCAR